MTVATTCSRVANNLMSFALMIAVASIATVLSPKVAAQASGPGIGSHLTFTLPGGKVMVAKVTKITAPHLEGDELSFEIKKEDKPDELADKLLSMTYSPGFDSYAEMRTNLKTGVRTIQITRTRMIVKDPAVKRQLHHPAAPLKTPLV